MTSSSVISSSVFGATVSSCPFIIAARRAGSAAASRPSWNACVFILIATPLISIACSMLAAVSGSRPFW
jgi:hypothetical protein